MTASIVFLQGIKCAILEKRSTTKNIESNPRWVRDSPRTKSILMSVQGWVGTGNGMYKPPFVAWPLDVWQTTQRSTKRATSRWSDYQKYESRTSLIVLSRPICPSLCNSCMLRSRQLPSGIYIACPHEREIPHGWQSHCVRATEPQAKCDQIMRQWHRAQQWMTDPEQKYETLQEEYAVCLKHWPPCLFCRTDDE